MNIFVHCERHMGTWINLIFVKYRIMMNRYRFFSLCLGLMCGLHLSAKDYYATDFGVKADGKTLNTSSIQKGIELCECTRWGALGLYCG